LLILLSENGFDLFITIDKNLKYQQNVDKISFNIFILDAPNNKISTLTPYTNVVIPLLGKELQTGITEIKI